MQLSISGFIAEDDGTGGSRVTQITDLSALGCAYRFSTIVSGTTSDFHCSLGAGSRYQDGHRKLDTQKFSEDRHSS